jgi:hypothetical protein
MTDERMALLELVEKAAMLIWSARCWPSPPTAS